VLFLAVLPLTITVSSMLLKGFGISLGVRSLMLEFRELSTPNFWLTKAWSSLTIVSVIKVLS
jgi:hypothetical protein